MNRMRMRGRSLRIGFAVLALAGCRAFADCPVATNVLSGTCVGEVRVVGAVTNGWTVTCERTGASVPGRDEFRIRMSSPVESQPPEVTVSFAVPQLDTHFIWHSGAENPALPPKWHKGFLSNLANGMPLMALIDADNRNRLAFAASEAVLPVRCRAGLREEDCTLPCSMSFFTRPTAPMRSYSVSFVIDRRDRRWDETVRDLSGWIGTAGGYRPMAVPAAAREPLYSTWYAFTQDVSAAKVEDEARRARELGLRTLILDDGWQTDEAGRAYERCGDLTVSEAKFPEGMSEHVRRVRALGIRYMVWFAVPFVGHGNAAYPRFKGKFLRTIEPMRCSVLDPRFPEVREYLVDLFARAQEEWGVDGFKFDYIGQFDLKGEEDPAEAEDYAGRDFRSVPDAVDALMSRIVARLKERNPDVLIEFRQPYVSPAIRRFGNMIRAIDCPGEMQKNIVRTAMLRLTSGETAVHSDMLEWNVEETPEQAAKPVLAALFSTIQYSMVLSRLPESHRAMLRHWIGFTARHRGTLLEGGVKAHHPESNFPLLEAESEAERVMAVYSDCAIVRIPDARPTYVVNATGSGSVVLDLARASVWRAYDTFGNAGKTGVAAPGLSRLDVPVSGYLEVTEGPCSPGSRRGKD